MSLKRTTIVLLGGGGVGKSSLTLRLMTNGFSEEYDATIEDSYYKTLTVDDKIEQIEVLDTAGQEEFHSMLDGWIRPADGIVLVYDITNRQTFDEINSFYNRVININDKIPIILVGNKCDAPDSLRKVYTSEGKHLADVTMHCSFIESSAKEKINDSELFYQLIRMIRNKREQIVEKKLSNWDKFLGCFH